MSIIAIVGDIHGKIDIMLEKVFLQDVDLIIQVGDFGTFISKENLDRGSRRHNGIGDFVEYYTGKKKFPVPVYFINGNHEDFNIIEKICAQPIPNLNYMKNGMVYDIDGVRFGAIGGNYSPTRFKLDKKHKKLQGVRRKHFNYQDIENLKQIKNIDVIIAHECPLDVGLISKFDKKECGSKEIRELIEEIQPKYYFHGHYHRFNETKINKSKVIGLGIIEGKSQSIYILDTNVMKY